MLPNICNIYNIRHPTFHLPLVKHDFAEQRLDYQLIKHLNTNESTSFTLKGTWILFQFLFLMQKSILYAKIVISPQKFFPQIQL